MEGEEPIESFKRKTIQDISTWTRFKKRKKKKLPKGIIKN